MILTKLKKIKFILHLKVKQEMNIIKLVTLADKIIAKGFNILMFARVDLGQSTWQVNIKQMESFIRHFWEYQIKLGNVKATTKW